MGLPMDSPHLPPIFRISIIITIIIFACKFIILQPPDIYQK
jgi:hypothetical protein